MKISRLKWIGPLVILVLLALFGGLAECAKKSSGSSASPVKAAPAAAPVEDASVIEEVTSKQLEKLLADKDYVAVYWCKCGLMRVCVVWEEYWFKIPMKWLEKNKRFAKFRDSECCEKWFFARPIRKWRFLYNPVKIAFQSICKDVVCEMAL